MEGLPKLCMLAHSVGVATDVDDMAVVQDAVDERRGHHLITEHLAPLFEAFVGSHNRGRTLIAAAHKLEEEHRSSLADRQVADLVDAPQDWGRQRIYSRTRSL